MWGKVRQGAPNRGAFFFWGKGAFSVVSFLLQGFRLCGGDKGAMETDEVRDRPLDPFGAVTPMLLDFLCCFIYSHVPFFLQDEKIAFSGAFNANKRMKSTRAVSSIRIIANRRESVKEA